jgi:hypothetical protein
MSKVTTKEEGEISILEREDGENSIWGASGYQISTNNRMNKSRSLQIDWRYLDQLQAYKYLG